MPKEDIKKIVYLVPHPPDYKKFNDNSKPEIFYKTQKDNWVGISGDEWADLIGKYVTKYDENIIFEVWQPDIRADKIYNAEISERVNHILFPAHIRKNLIGAYYYSEKILKKIKKNDENIIYQMGVFGDYYYELLKKIKIENKIIGTLHGEITTHRQKIFKPRKNQLRTIGHMIDYLKFRKNINRYNVITYLSDVNVNNLKKLYNGILYKINMGIDVSVFKKLSKSLCRKELNLPQDKKIILSVGRLDYAKQNHELLKILNELCPDYDFLVVFIGHGEKSYEDYLKKISWELFNKNQILFTGYLYPEMLVKYYNSADLFFMSSAGEGAPVVSMEALACGVPVITTETGNVAEFIKEHSIENVVGRYDYNGWKSILMKFLRGNEIKKIDMEFVKERYSWESVSRKFIEIYRSL